MKTNTHSVSRSRIRLASSLLFACVFALIAQASKPEAPGGGKPDMRSEAKSAGGAAKSEATDKAGDAEGRARQIEKKADQERKELGKGSEKGREMREKNSRKWWRFWGNDKPVE